MENYLDSELIILEVEKYPCLYDARHSDFKNREAKRDAWMAVARSVIDKEWDQMDENARSNAGIEVKKRWKSMKDSFLKSIKNEEGKNGEARRIKKKPYVYRKQMSFLDAIYQQRETSGNMNTDNDTLNTEAPAAKREEPAAKRKAPAAKREAPAAKTEAPAAKREEPAANSEEPVIVAGTCSRKPNERKSDAFQKEIFDVPMANLVQPPTNMQDPDEMFLMSQLPNIKKINPSDKLQFQIKFMELIQTFSDPNSNSYESTPYQTTSILKSFLSSGASASTSDRQKRGTKRPTNDRI